LGGPLGTQLGGGGGGGVCAAIEDDKPSNMSMSIKSLKAPVVFGCE